MSKFSKLVNDFDGVLQTVSDRTAELYAKKAELEGQKMALKANYDEAVIANTMGTLCTPADELRKMWQKVQDLNREITATGETIDTINAFRNRKLAEHMPAMIAAKHEEFATISERVSRKQDALRKHKAEILLAFVELHAEFRAYQEIKSDLQRAASAIGYELPRDFADLPVVSIVNHYQPDKSIAPTEMELREAFYQGKVPASAEVYRLTGEFMSDSEAFELLQSRKSKKGAK